MDALTSLQQMGATRDDLAARLRLALSQRGVRRICEHCFGPAGLSPRTLQRFGLTSAESREMSPLHGSGCDACEPLAGYHGRETLLELLPATGAVRRLLAAGMDLRRESGHGPGLRTLRQACLDLLGRGLTTIEEFQKLNLAPAATIELSMQSSPERVSL
jgi:type II secretory ATPase GspE/PulE/Tfp pilus assembly ATPase PilB-like protein